jgi:hypothetical protein
MSVPVESSNSLSISASVNPKYFGSSFSIPITSNPFVPDYSDYFGYSNGSTFAIPCPNI